MYVTAKDLPPILQNALRAAGVRHKDIEVRVGDTFDAPGSFGKGYRGQVVVVNLTTGEMRHEAGSWGGDNPFEHRPVDEPSGESHLPPGFAALTTSARHWTLHLNPANVAAVLPSAGGEVTPREAYLLGTYAGLTSAGRKYEFEHHRSAAPHPGEIEALAARGLLNVNRAGAVGITTAGRNLAGTALNRPDRVPRDPNLTSEKPKRITAEDLLGPIGIKPRS